MDDVGKVFKSFKILLVVASITFSILITFFVINQSSVFEILQEFNALIEGTQNNATNKQGIQNIATVQATEKKNLNISEPVVGKFTL